MTAPSKPWELNTGRQFDGNLSLLTGSDGLHSSAPLLGGQFPPQLRNVRTAPPLPSRQHQVRSGFAPRTTSYYPSSYMGNYGSGYSGYGGLGALGGSFGGYGNYGYGMNQFGFGRGVSPESRFIQMAEEGSRPAFQSIESIVQAFCSVSFMMESTFNAMYSSFRAVLGVAENFGQLRSLFGQFLSVFAVFRWLRWSFKKCLYYLGLQSTNPLFPNAEAVPDSSKKPLSWPVIFFLAIVFTGPYLMWKLLNSLNIPSIDPYNPADWQKCKRPAFSAVVLHDFNAASEQELSIQAGHKIAVAPKELQPRGNSSWLLATKGKKVGLVPSNYIQILGPAILTNVKKEQTSGQVESSVPQVTLPPQGLGASYQVQPTIPPSDPQVVGLPQGVSKFNQMRPPVQQIFRSSVPQVVFPPQGVLGHQVQQITPPSGGVGTCYQGLPHAQPSNSQQKEVPSKAGEEVSHIPGPDGDKPDAPQAVDTLSEQSDEVKKAG